jgi:hypothetical protein
MGPNQYPTAPQGNPYDFILNPDQQPKKRGVGSFKGNFAVTIGLIVGGVIILMVFITILLNTFGAKQVNPADIVGLAQTQTELLRISRQATSNATQQVTRNLATTIEYTMITQQKQTLDVLGKLGEEVNNKELSLKQNAATDQKFTTAKSTSTFDQTFTEIIQTELDNYANTLKTLSTTSASQSERDRMSDYYRQVQQLISQIPYTQDNIESADTVQAAQ